MIPLGDFKHINIENKYENKTKSLDGITTNADENFVERDGG